MCCLEKWMSDGRGAEQRRGNGVRADQILRLEAVCDESPSWHTMQRFMSACGVEIMVNGEGGARL